ncbi:MAG TPA: hypothetical protein VNH14_07790 [Gemmatimonadales bacterium]|nr:hypothetical protein [Gemmatimonadales bacterium]
MRPLALVVAALAISAASLPAQRPGTGQSGRRTLLPRSREIALARSAAPAAVSDSATIYVLGQKDYEVAVTGTNGNACFVDRDRVETIAPHCFNAEGAATIMPLEMHRIALLHQEHSVAETDREIADGLASGRFRLPRRPVLSYMMSADQNLFDDDGKPNGHWYPHLMLYIPYITGAELGLGKTGSDGKAAIVQFEGTPLANVMIVVRDFLQPAGGSVTER